MAIVFIEQGQRRIPVQFAKRVVGRRMYGGQSTYIPLKVNQSGVIPIIFASSVLYFPVLHLQRGAEQRLGRRGAELHRRQPGRTRATSCYIIVYGVLIVAFAYFYTAIAFDPHQQADTIRKQGGYIPGIRPGPPTERHLAGHPQPHHAARRAVPRLHRPPAVAGPRRSGASTSTRSPARRLLIAVGVALETMKQIDSQLMMRNYEGFLK